MLDISEAEELTVAIIVRGRIGIVIRILVAEMLLHC